MTNILPMIGMQVNTIELRKIASSLQDPVDKIVIALCDELDHDYWSSPRVLEIMEKCQCDNHLTSDELAKLTELLLRLEDSAYHC